MPLQQELLNKIKQNSTDGYLNLQAQDLEDEDIDNLIAALKENNTVEAINLSQNENITDAAVKRLVEELASNFTVSTLNLIETGAGRQTAERLSVVLDGNKTLVKFDGLPSINDLQGLRQGRAKTEFIDLINKIEIQLTKNLGHHIFEKFQLTGALPEEDIYETLLMLENRYPAIKSNLEQNDDGAHYIPEAYRILKGLHCMSIGSDEENANVRALNYLVYPYESELQDVANLALAQCLFTAENLNAADPAIQEARYQLLLHSAQDEADKPNSPWMFMLSYALMRATHQGKNVPGSEFGHTKSAITKKEITDYLSSVDMKKTNTLLLNYLVPPVNKSPSPSQACPRLFSSSAAASSSAAPALNQLTKKK